MGWGPIELASNCHFLCLHSADWREYQYLLWILQYPSIRYRYDSSKHVRICSWLDFSLGACISHLAWLKLPPFECHVTKELDQQYRVQQFYSVFHCTTQQDPKWGEKLSGSKKPKAKMFQTNTEYDRGVNTFSPEGRLFQVEYAIEAIKMGTTAIGLRTKEGVVLAVEKRLTSPLLEPGSIEKIMEVDRHVGAAMSGITADAQTLIDHARVEATNHWFSYNEPVRVQALTQSICDLALSFGEGSDENNHKQKMSRPFGVALLLAGVDEAGPQLFFSEPSGTYWPVKAHAIGSGSEGALNNLKDGYTDELTLQEAETLAIGALKQHMEEKLTSINVELAIVTREKGFHVCTAEELEVVIARL